MRPLNATLINLYMVCPRECWLHANGINMEHTSDVVYDGKLLHESGYPQREERYTEVELEAEYLKMSLKGKVDFYDPKAKVIHETKRGDQVENAHEWQVKFYIWLFGLNGIGGVTGKLEYPRLRQTTEVLLSESDRQYLEKLVPEIDSIIQQEYCPKVLNAGICRSCSYYEFCYS